MCGCMWESRGAGESGGVCGECVWEPVGKCWGKEVRTGKVVRECGGVGVVCIGLRSGREQAEWGGQCGCGEFGIGKSCR